MNFNNTTNEAFFDPTYPFSNEAFALIALAALNSIQDHGELVLSNKSFILDDRAKTSFFGSLLYGSKTYFVKKSVFNDSLARSFDEFLNEDSTSGSNVITIKPMTEMLCFKKRDPSSGPYYFVDDKAYAFISLAALNSIEELKQVILSAESFDFDINVTTNFLDEIIPNKKFNLVKKSIFDCFLQTFLEARLDKNQGTNSSKVISYELLSQTINQAKREQKRKIDKIKKTDMYLKEEVIVR